MSYLELALKLCKSNPFNSNITVDIYLTKTINKRYFCSSLSQLCSNVSNKDKVCHTAYQTEPGGMDSVPVCNMGGIPILGTPNRSYTDTITDWFWYKAQYRDSEP